MPSVRSIVTDALMEIGAASPGEAPSAADAALALLRFRNQLDAWQADNLTLSLQAETSVSWPSTTSTRTVGPGGNINIQRPVTIDALSYTLSPAQEVFLTPLSTEQYTALSLKGLTGAYPVQFAYTTSNTTALGTLFLWPQPSQALTLTLYTPQGIDVPADLNTILLGPPGYQEAFMYQLALRLCGPFGKPIPPLLPQLARDAFATMKRPNVSPGVLGMDPAVTGGTGAGYDVLSDQ